MRNAALGILLHPLAFIHFCHQQWACPFWYLLQQYEFLIRRGFFCHRCKVFKGTVKTGPSCQSSPGKVCRRFLYWHLIFTLEALQRGFNSLLKWWSGRLFSISSVHWLYDLCLFSMSVTDTGSACRNWMRDVVTDGCLCVFLFVVCARPSGAELDWGFSFFLSRGLV